MKKSIMIMKTWFGLSAAFIILPHLPDGSEIRYACNLAGAGAAD